VYSVLFAFAGRIFLIFQMLYQAFDSLQHTYILNMIIKSKIFINGYTLYFVMGDSYDFRNVRFNVWLAYFVFIIDKISAFPS
jgi:hypothetical protein